MVADPTDPKLGMILQGFGISQRFWQESGYSLFGGGQETWEFGIGAIPTRGANSKDVTHNDSARSTRKSRRMGVSW